MNSSEIAATLSDSGLCICPGFLSKKEVHIFRSQLNAVRAREKFHRAGIGQGTAREVHDLVRRDEIFWIERSAPDTFAEELWAKLDELQNAFNTSPLYLGIKDFEGHYARYAQGGYYRRHLDRLRKNNTRVVSLIIYLNENWSTRDGGCLRLYNDSQDKAKFIEVDPVGGTMVCFMSEDLEHEVSTCNSTRLSISGWFRN
jgi:SM-20-related protein